MRPAATKAMKGTTIGPGAMASPDFKADQPQMPCSQSTIESSIPPNEAEKKMATIDAPLNVRERNSDGWMSMPALVEAAHPAEAVVKMATPTRKPRSRRYRSARRPKKTRSDA